MLSLELHVQHGSDTTRFESERYAERTNGLSLLGQAILSCCRVK